MGIPSLNSAIFILFGLQYAHESHGLPSPTPKHIKPHHRGDTIILRAQGCRSMYP